jgi:hypothetical protein
MHMDMGLEGRTAPVAVASKGIGKAIARGLANTRLSRCYGARLPLDKARKCLRRSVPGIGSALRCSAARSHEKSRAHDPRPVPCDLHGGPVFVDDGSLFVTRRDFTDMATYTCEKCGMSVNMTCAKCDAPLEHDSLSKDDGSKVAISQCPNGHGKVKSPMCCGQDMSCAA